MNVNTCGTFAIFFAPVIVFASRLGLEILVIPRTLLSQFRAALSKQ